MRIAVLSETDPVETRVAATPDMVKKYKNLGADIVVQAGAEGQASIADADFESAGATIAQNAGDAVQDADIVLKVRRPADANSTASKQARSSSASWTLTVRMPRSKGSRTPAPLHSPWS